MVLPIAPLEAPLCCGQLFLCIIQAVQLLQTEVAPHYVQLQHCVIINCVQQLCATLTGKINHYFLSHPPPPLFNIHKTTLGVCTLMLEKTRSSYLRQQTDARGTEIECWSPSPFTDTGLMPTAHLKALQAQNELWLLFNMVSLKA